MTKPDKRAQIEFRAVSSLRGYERNARTHSPEQVAQLAASIREFGFTNPVLVTPEGMIVAGHGRVAAAQEIGLVEVPTLVVGADWSPEKVRAYVLADNKLALNAGWDNEILRAELDELRGVDFEIGLIGFSESELAAILTPENVSHSQTDAGHEKAESAQKTLAERFGLAPFSVLSARGGWWQDRKRAWLTLGIESEVGRGENLLRFSDTINEPDPEKRAARAIANKVASFRDQDRLQAIMSQKSKGAA